ncbi:hypothetical protein LTR36_006192 [Oleoguttula mirabilis]|uniref:Transmembrane protein n=1 Tax=Oleoguttula mirabilis TaxID=1507867 RepID=A0AAV9JCE8_9PEZI|nr:hypothetical protein LTR36_006192 [Oleoguttula mirabilis]
MVVDGVLKRVTVEVTGLVSVTLLATALYVTMEVMMFVVGPAEEVEKITATTLVVPFTVVVESGAKDCNDDMVMLPESMDDTDVQNRPEVEVGEETSVLNPVMISSTPSG